MFMIYLGHKHNLKNENKINKLFILKILLILDKQNFLLVSIYWNKQLK